MVNEVNKQIITFNPLGGMQLSQEAKAQGKPFMLVDYEKATKLIEEALKTVNLSLVRAELGLMGDWDYNATVIWENGEHHPYDAYEGSMWATPTLILYLANGEEISHECWKEREV